MYEPEGRHQQLLRVDENFFFSGQGRRGFHYSVCPPLLRQPVCAGERASVCVCAKMRERDRQTERQGKGCKHLRPDTLALTSLSWGCLACACLSTAARSSAASYGVTEVSPYLATEVEGGGWGVGKFRVQGLGFDHDWLISKLLVKVAHQAESALLVCGRLAAITAHPHQTGRLMGWWNLLMIGSCTLLALRPLLFVCVFAGEGLTPPSSCRRGGCDRVSAATSAGRRRATSDACWASSIRVPRSVPNGEDLRFWRCVWRSVSDELAARMHALACIMTNVHVCMRSHIMINVTHTRGPLLSALPKP